MARNKFRPKDYMKQCAFDGCYQPRRPVGIGLSEYCKDHYTKAQRDGYELGTRIGMAQQQTNGRRIIKSTRGLGG